MTERLRQASLKIAGKGFPFGPRFLHSRFSTYRTPDPLQKRALNAVRNLAMAIAERRKLTRPWLILAGNPGTGKSHLLASVFWHLAENPRPEDVLAQLPPGWRSVMTDRFPYAQAHRVATAIVDSLRPACERIEIAGSLRRKRYLVHDIDLVLISRLERIQAPQRGLFAADDTVEQRAIDGCLIALQEAGKIGDLAISDKIIRCMAIKSGIPIDIYLAKPSTWATILLIRTGSKEHNIMLARRARQRGLILKADGTGLISANGKPAGAFLEEERLFRFLGLRYVPPENREVGIEAEGIAQ